MKSNLFGLAAGTPTLIFLAGALAALAESPVTMFRYTPSHCATLAADSVEIGEMAWRFNTGAEVRSTPAVAGGLAVFGSGDGFLYAVDLTTGAERWKVGLGGPVTSSPAVAQGMVIVMGGDGRLHGRRLDNGSPVWAHATGPDLPLGNDPRTFDMWASSPTVSDGTVYVGGGDGRVYAVDLATGRERWSHPTASRVRSSPAVGGGLVYVGSFDGCVYALDAATGRERWKYQTGDVVQSSPALGGGMVYFGTRAAAVLALDAGTGALKWRRPHSGSWVLSSAAVAKGRVIIGGSDSHLLEALDAQTGEPVWSMPVGARTLGSPTVIGDVVAYGAEDFRVYTLDAATGLGLSMGFTEGAIYSSVVPVAGLLLAGSDDHNLYAFRTRSAVVPSDSAPAAALRVAEGRYRTKDGDLYTLSLHHGRLSLAYCTYPPALVVMHSDGSFACTMLWGMTGRMQGEPGRPVSALILSLFGHESVAERVEVSTLGTSAGTRYSIRPFAHPGEDGSKSEGLGAEGAHPPIVGNPIGKNVSFEASGA